LEEWNDAVEIVKAVEVVQIAGRPKQKVGREKGMVEECGKTELGALVAFGATRGG